MHLHHRHALLHFLLAFLHFCPFPAHWAPTLPQLHAAPLNLRPTGSVWQCSKGETNSAIGHALPQPHPSSSELRSSVGSVGWPPQWAPFFLAQMPSPPPSVPQRSFSLSPNKPRVAGDSWMAVAATNKSTCKCCYFQTCHLGVTQPASSTHTMAAHVLMRPPGNNQTRRALTRPCVGDHRPAEVLHLQRMLVVRASDIVAKLVGVLGLDAAARVAAAQADLPTPHAPRAALCEDVVFGAEEKLCDESSAASHEDGATGSARLQMAQMCCTSYVCNPGSAAPHSVLETCRRSIRAPLGHGVPSSFPSQQSSPDAGANARKNCALCSVSAYRTKAAQCASPRRLRIPHLCPMRDLVCVSSALHRLDARSRHTRCTAALAGQAGGARRRKPRSGSASARSMAVGCTRRRTGFCLHSDVFAFGTPPSASLCSLLCYSELCSGVCLTAWGTSRQHAGRTECRASCCSAPLMSTVVVHAHRCRSGSL